MGWQSAVEQRVVSWGIGDLAEQIFKLILSRCSRRCSSLCRAILEHRRHSSLVGLVGPGQLFQGHLAEGNYNCTLGAQEEPLRQVDVEDDIELDDVVLVDENENRQSADASVKNIELLASRDEGAEGSSVVRLQQERTKKDEQEEKSPKKSTRIENMMEKYLEMRTKQAEDESAQLAKETEHTQGADFSIKKCISVLRSMEVTKEEKAKAYAVFKTTVNRKLFLCAYEDDLESALIWLRSEMA